MKKLLLFFAGLLVAAMSFGQPAGFGTGDHTWEIKNDTLYIGGTGDLAKLSSKDNQPWASSRTAIKTVVVGIRAA